MDYIYAAMWLIAAVILAVRFGKENRIFYLASLFFVALGACWLVRPLLNINLFTGTASWIMRGIMAIMLVVFSFAYYRETKRISGSKDGKDVQK